jgi:hypothetical protein
MTAALFIAPCRIPSRGDYMKDVQRAMENQLNYKNDWKGGGLENSLTLYTH